MLLKACLNGPRRPADHPALPVTPAQLATAAVAAVAAGAGALHIHPKDAAGVDTLAGPAVAAELPPAPTEPVMVVRSLRLPVDLDQRLKRAARSRGVPMSTLLREWIELELAALENDQPISRADALRALATLRPLNGAA